MELQDVVVTRPVILDRSTYPPPPLPLVLFPPVPLGHLPPLGDCDAGCQRAFCSLCVASIASHHDMALESGRKQSFAPLAAGLSPTPSGNASSFESKGEKIDVSFRGDPAEGEDKDALD